MIADFLDSWALFGDAYLVGCLIAVLLSLQGILIVARDQIFVGAAVAQAAALGISLGMVVGSAIADAPIDPLHAHQSLSAAAIAAAAAASWFARREHAHASFEATTGWIFLLASSASILLLAHSPHGLEEIHHLLSSSIIGATRTDVWVFGGLTLAAVAFIAGKRDALTLFMMDPNVAAAIGLPVRRWSQLFALALGVSIGLAMRSSGLLYSFGCLVLPPLIAAQLCRNSRPLFVVAPIIALATALTGFVIANSADYPPAQMAVALQAGFLGVAWLVRASIGIRSAASGQ